MASPRKRRTYRSYRNAVARLLNRSPLTSWLTTVFDRFGMEFVYHGSTVLYTWPWRRKSGYKFIDLNSEGGFNSLKELDEFWNGYHQHELQRAFEEREAFRQIESVKRENALLRAKLAYYDNHYFLDNSKLHAITDFEGNEVGVPILKVGDIIERMKVLESKRTDFDSFWENTNRSLNVEDPRELARGIFDRLT